MGMFRVAVPVALVLAAGAPLAGQQRTVVAVPGYTTLLELDTLAIGGPVAAARGRVFSAVLEAYRTLKIPLPLIDSARGVVGNWNYRAPRTMAGQRMSSWLSCGMTMTGLIADEYRIAVWIHTTMAAKGPDSTTLRTALVAGATSVDGASRQQMPCLSTGRFEARVQALVEEWLAAHP
jgi:hypothetical protein